MAIYLLLVVAGAALSLSATPLVRATALSLGLVDAPGGRKVHSTTVPRLGGVAVGLATGAAVGGTLLVLRGLGAETPPLQPLAAIVAGAALVFGVGVADDVRPLPAWAKLTVQVVAAGIAVGSGLLIERITLAGQTWQLGWLAGIVTVGWIVVLTNAFNLIDGLDGLAAGVTAIAGAACAAILVARGHAAEAMLLAALVGAALGFLVFNFAPASIFLGDGGSLLAGFLLATTAITGWQKGATALAAGVPLLIFALPLADAVSALVRRLARRPASGVVSLGSLWREVVAADRLHIHHRLTARGWSTRRTVLVLYAVTALLSLVALATAQLD